VALLVFTVHVQWAPISTLSSGFIRLPDRSFFNFQKGRDSLLFAGLFILLCDGYRFSEFHLQTGAKVTPTPRITKFTRVAKPSAAVLLRQVDTD